MRLIHTATGRFQEFFESQRPRYAILSHTWGNDELSYLDFLSLHRDLPDDAVKIMQALQRNPSRDSEGYRKTEACCSVASSRGFDWVWIDSCCIDKSSSAEVSEAINSMWAWYRDAAECLVHLFDVSTTAEEFRSNQEAWDSFRRARWFSRGWTLPELLAPKNVIFYNNRWEVLANKVEVGKELEAITNIPLIFLDGTYDPSDSKLCSTAMKMSWISRRQTTRTEDMAYCMLGLFDVHMPLIYGEGRRAFMRLQLEIIKRIDDDSIFAWQSEVDSSGVLATWPIAFAESGNIVQIEFPDDPTPWLPPMMTSIGLELRARYQRFDPQTQAIDAQHGVHTISTSFVTKDETILMMHCSPCTPNGLPITQRLGPQDVGPALVIKMKRFGATWQRVNCRTMEFGNYAMWSPSQNDAYRIYYVGQQGL